MTWGGARTGAGRKSSSPGGEAIEESSGEEIKMHCEVCQRPAHEEPWLPPLDERTGHRVLAQDPLGWAEDHGPDYALACCRTTVCYDVRPGHRGWPQ